jgi:hypothetical protein
MEPLSHLDATRPLLMIVMTSVGDITGVRPFMRGVNAVARILGFAPPNTNGLRIRPMSSEWLRQHGVDCEKHRTDA